MSSQTRGGASPTKERAAIPPSLIATGPGWNPGGWGPAPGAVLHVVLIRHGETTPNLERIIQGQSDGEITERGRQQAQLLGKRLMREKYEAVYCSDLKRVRQTVEEIKRVQPPEHKFDLNFKTELRERNAGEFEGHPYGSIDAAARAAGESPRSFTPRWGESWEDVRARAENFLQGLVEEHLPPPNPTMVGIASKADKKRPGDQKSVLVVTHGGFVKEWIDTVSHYGGGCLASDPITQLTSQKSNGPRWPSLGQTGKGGGMHYPNRAKNTGVFRFDVTWKSGRLNVSMVQENDVSHLRGLGDHAFNA